jgi:hypothetical protein
MLTRRTGPDRKEFVTTRPAARPPDKIRKRLGWALALALRPGSSWSRCGSAIHQRGRLLPTPFAHAAALCLACWPDSADCHANVASTGPLAGKLHCNNDLAADQGGTTVHSPSEDSAAAESAA